MKKYNKLILISVITLIIDILSKVLIKHFVLLGERITIISNIFYITYVRNTGAAFSILRNNTFILILLTIVIIVFIYFYLKDKDIRKLESIGYGLILGGAVGNLFNRVIYGYVIDFIDIYIFKYDYPVFNIADIAIVVGVILLFIDIIRGETNGDKSR